MIEFVEYVDDQIRIRLPKQLREQRSRRYFFGRLVRSQSASEVSVAISIDMDPLLVETDRRLFLDNRPVTEPEGFKVERSGPCNFGEEGLERLTSSAVPGMGYTLRTWDVLGRLQGRYVLVSVMGGGTQEDFRSMAKEIIESFRLLSPSEREQALAASGGAKIKNVKRGGMRSKQKARLAKALESLPDNLKYLRDPVLAIADEDQDMLGSGEVDMTSLSEALRQQAASQPSGFASDHAEQLEEWAQGLAGEEDLWAAPIWFVRGAMLGYDTFGEEQPGA